MRRDDVFLVSKVLPSNASLAGTVAACERAWRACATDRLDCYLLHWLGSHPLEDTLFAGFERLREQGKILSWGVSNLRCVQPRSRRKAGGEGRIACNQVLYHLEECAIEHAVQPWCEDHASPSSPTARSAMAAFPAHEHRRAASWMISRANHGATARLMSRSGSSRGGRPPSRSPRRSLSRAYRRQRQRWPLRLTEDEFMRIDAAFPRGPGPRHLPML